jgi:hypothetical protein
MAKNSKSKSKAKARPRVESRSQGPLALSNLEGAVSVHVKLDPLRDQLRAMCQLLGMADSSPDRDAAMNALTQAADLIEQACGGMGTDVTFGGH